MVWVPRTLSFQPIASLLMNWKPLTSISVPKALALSVSIWVPPASTTVPRTTEPS